MTTWKALSGGRRAPMRRLAGALVAVCLGAGGLASAAPAQPTVVLLHGGGWRSGWPGAMQPWEDDFRAHGYTRVHKLAYPFGNVLTAIAGVRAQIRAFRPPVIAYGVSAGGTIAAALAASGDVAAGINVVGPTDLVNWPTGTAIMAGLRMSRQERRAASPILRLSNVRPQLQQAGLADPIVTSDQARRYHRAAVRLQPDTTLQLLANAHGQLPSERASARRWVQARWPPR